MMTREEHLQFCKDRALEYLNRGDIVNAGTSMLSDLSKHEETRDIGKSMSQLGMMYMVNRDFDGMRKFIEGFR